MKGKVLGAMAALFVVLFGSTAMALDASTPYTIPIHWYVPEVTTFSVTTPGSVGQISFNYTTNTDGGMEPEGQDAAAGTPMLNISNDGNVQMDVSINLTTGGGAKPAFVNSLIVSNTSDNTSASDFGLGIGTLVETDIEAGETTAAYLWSSIVDGTAGTSSSEVQISVNASA